MTAPLWRAWSYHHRRWHLLGTAGSLLEANALFHGMPQPPTASHYCVTAGGQPTFVPRPRDQYQIEKGSEDGHGE